MKKFFFNNKSEQKKNMLIDGWTEKQQFCVFPFFCCDIFRQLTNSLKTDDKFKSLLNLLFSVSFYCIFLLINNFLSIENMQSEREPTRRRDWFDAHGCKSINFKSKISRTSAVSTTFNSYIINLMQFSFISLACLFFFSFCIPASSNAHETILLILVNS